MSYWRRLSSPRGFSLVQVLIATGLLGVLALAFSQLFSGAFKTQQRVQNAVDFDILKTSLNQVFSTKACDGALYTGAALTIFVFPPGMLPGTNLVTAATPGGITVDEVKHGNSPVVVRNQVLSGSLKITGLAITSAIYDGDQAVDPILRIAFSARFRLEATKLGSIASAPLDHTLPVRLLAAATNGRVEKCGSSGPEALTCPAGMTKVGSDPLTEYCISTAKESPDRLSADASLACATKSPAARLCDQNEWIRACGELPASLGFLTGTAERNLDAGCRGGSGASGSCTTWSSNCNPFSEVMPYRCCYP